MSFVAFIIVVVFVYRFWDVFRVSEATAKKAAHSSLNAVAKAAAKLEATTPNLSEAELNSIREGRRQLLVLEDIEKMSDEELRQLFEAKETKAKK